MWTLCPPTSSPPPSHATFATTSTKQNNQLRFFLLELLFIKLHTRSHRWRKTGAKLQPAKNISPTTATGANKLRKQFNWMQGQRGMVSWEAVDGFKAERERKEAGGRASGNCHLNKRCRLSPRNCPWGSQRPPIVQFF